MLGFTTDVVVTVAMRTVQTIQTAVYSDLYIFLYIYFCLHHDPNFLLLHVSISVSILIQPLSLFHFIAF